MERCVAELLCGGAELTEDLGAAYVLLGCDLLEVRRTVVEGIAVEMVDLHAGRTWTNPRLIDEDVAAFCAKISHHNIATMAACLLAWTVRTVVRFDLVNTSPCDGEEPPTLRAIELRRTLFGLGVSAQTQSDPLVNELGNGRRNRSFNWSQN